MSWSNCLQRSSADDTRRQRVNGKNLHQLEQVLPINLAPIWKEISVPVCSIERN